MCREAEAKDGVWTLPRSPLTSWFLALNAALPPTGCRPSAFPNSPFLLSVTPALLPGESSLGCDYHLEPSGHGLTLFRD